MCASTKNPSNWKLALVLFGLLSADQARAMDVPFVWPNGTKAAVSLAYDDALNSQLDHAIPALDQYGLKATFYLVMGNEAVRTRLLEWRAAAANGHELGNHTLFHQCSAKGPDRGWVTPDNDLEKTSVGQMQAQTRLANTMLAAIDGKQSRTFAVPCGDAMAAGGNYLAGLRGDFVGMKTAFGGVPATMRGFDPHATAVYIAENVTGAQLIAQVQAAANAGTMINITFHGVGGDYLSVSKEAHAELLAYLAANRAIYWTDTFLAIMQYVTAKKP